MWDRILIEGVVIVASILLAFGIDALWEEAQDRSRTRSHLQMLQAEIAGVRSAVNDSQARRERRIDVIRSLLEAITTGETSAADSLENWLGELWERHPPERIWQRLN